MDKNQAKTIIKDTFESKFDKLKFKRFIVNLLNIKSSMITDPGVSFNINQISNTYQPFIDSFEKIAEYKSDKNKVDVLTIRLKKETSIERARTMQRNFVAWYLKGGCDGEFKDAALAAFISPDENDWRFSLIKLDYSLGEDKKGKIKISEKMTPAKRWSFLVGANEKSHTAQSQLIDIVAIDDKDITLSQLEEAFDVEKVTKEFFKKYRDLFLKTKEALDKILLKDDRVKSDFESKDINTVDFSKKLLGQIVFLYFLQKKGWFGVARDADWGTGPKNFLRELFEGKHSKYKNFFNDILEPLFYNALRIDRSANDDYHDKFNCKIPFLNGGLFDPIGEYDWVHTDINLPNELFSNDELTKEGDKGTGILDIFDRYNFTVKEDEPLEKEVAVDPEMLGKVFENLLEVKDRKSKGTYYTPREIVHYMCQQSLINYLATELDGKVSQEDIELLFKYGEQFGENNTELVDNLGGDDIPESIIKNADLIDNKLLDIKVCDPAVGSGAFLVGVMAEIVRARNILSFYINDSDRTIYNFKRECIENSLYGVDIDPGAVEIAKLRLWLSLVVDEEDIKKIKPLPNLDYKIVCGNSLMSIEKNLFNQELFSKLESLKKEFFDEINPNKKKELKDRINETIFKITNGHKEFDFEVYFSEVFHKKGGFDVAVANPPYGLVFDNAFKKYLNRVFHSFRRNNDLYIAFYERGFNLTKYDGILTYITPNTFLNGEYFKFIRELLSEKTLIKEILDFKELVIFDSPKVFVCILSFIKKLRVNYPYYLKYKVFTHNINNCKLEKIEINKSGNHIFKPVDKIYLKIFDLRDIEVIDKLFHVKDVGFNYWTIGKGKKRDGNSIGDRIFYKGDKINSKDIPFLKGKDIFRYGNLVPANFLKHDYHKFLNPGVDVFRYTLKYLEKKPKIIYRQTSSKIIATIDNDGFFIDKTVHLIIPKTNIIKLDLRYIIALLNSKLFEYLYRYISQEREGRLFAQIKTVYIKQLPIKKAIDEQESICKIVDKIFSLTKGRDYLKDSVKQAMVKEYESQINGIIYRLYKLNEEEIAIIEGEV